MSEQIDESQEKFIRDAVQQFIDAQVEGREPDIEEFVNKYPEFKHQIRKRISNILKIDSLFASLTKADESDYVDTESGQDLTGQKIGNFEIVEMIGRGGMGIVYLAQDTKLDRPVAIKSLPVEFVGDSTTRMRFTREAKVLASLSHPNIGVIHDIIEQTEGSAYLVLEYVPGETLAERLAKGPLKLQEALTIALQIAEAVAVAHENDVIHRDLKPGNIKITPDARVKVLDFGLAKALSGESSEKSSTVTQPGRIMGTPAYMSPEQVRGKPTDKRSDIWSFGCVMYEMLTGQLPFEGETATDTLARIIEREPDWETLPQEVPMNIRTLLRRCLEKDPNRRLRDIGDASIEIHETLSIPAIAPPVTSSSITVTQPTKPRRLMAWGVACLIVVALLASLITWVLTRPDQLPRQAVRRFIIRPETSLRGGALWHKALTVSPDGKRLAYVEEGSDKKGQICLQELDEFKVRTLPGTEYAINPFFSPDGQWVGYVDSLQSKLKKVSIKGGEPVPLCDCPQFHGGSWADDDTIIFTPAEFEGLWSISASGEGLKQLTVPDPCQYELGHFWPQILPDGKTVLFINERIAGTGQDQIETFSLETRKRKLLIKGARYARYVSTGHIVYGSKDTIHAVRFDLERLETIGSAVPVVTDVKTSAQFTVSMDGTLAYVPAQARISALRPVWVDRDGQVEALKRTIPGQYFQVRISPDGTKAAFAVYDQGKLDVWIYNLSRQTVNPLTSDGISWTAIWTPDSKQVVFLKTTGLQVFVQNADGSGEPKLLAQFEDWYYYPASYSTDGKEILIVGLDNNHQERQRDISVIVLEQNEQPRLRPFIQRDFNQHDARWSPDGRWVAYMSDESRRSEVYVEPYPGPGPKITISTDGGSQPVWSKDGKELFYLSGSGDTVTVIAVTIETEPEFKVVSSQELFEGRYKIDTYHSYDVAPDGRFLMIQDPRESTPVEINIVLNWFEELKQLVPTENGE